MIAQLARTSLEQNAIGLHRHWRQRIRLGARRIERARARFTGDAKVPFSLGVVGLKVGVGDGPVGKAGARDGAFLARLDEIDFVKAPVVRGEVYRAAAHQLAIHDARLLLCFVLRSLAERLRLLAPVVGERRIAPVEIFVVTEILRGLPWPLLEHHNAEAILRKLARQHATRGATADDDEVHRFGERIAFLRMRSGAHAFSSGCAS